MINTNLPYYLYMMETEGLLGTRESLIRKVIKEIKDYPCKTISEDLFYLICEKCGIPAKTLTDYEIRRIKNEIKES